MQKRNRSRNRKMSGGFLDSLSNSISSGWNSLSQGASSAWNKTKSAATNAYSSATTSSSTPSSYTPTTSVTPTYTTGGRKRSRKMRGGYGDNIAITGLAANAAPISDIKSAQPLTTVGGRRTKRRRGGKHRHGKSCKHRRH
jgi:hypothetical protein